MGFRGKWHAHEWACVFIHMQLACSMVRCLTRTGTLLPWLKGFAHRGKNLLCSDYRCCSRYYVKGCQVEKISSLFTKCILLQGHTPTLYYSRENFRQVGIIFLWEYILSLHPYTVVPMFVQEEPSGPVSRHQGLLLKYICRVRTII